jgi:hypothetical protein
MAGNNFASPKYVDHKILDKNGKAVGEIRIKPSGILWCPKGKHSWYGLSLEAFAKYAEENGKEQKK